MLYKKLLLLLILFTFIVSSASINPPTNPSEQDFVYWLKICLTIIVIHFMIVALVYMYSNFFFSDDLKVWSKNEIMQGVYSILIIISFMGVFTFINGLAEGFFAQIIDEGITVKTISVTGTEPQIKDISEYELHSFCFDKDSNRWSTDEDICDLKVESNGKGKVSCSGTGSDNCNPLFLMARSYLGISYERLANLHKLLFRNYALMNAYNTQGFSSGIHTCEETAFSNFGASITMAFTKDGIYISILESLILFVEKLLLMLKFQESVLKFMEYGLAFFLIVLGLLFRSIFIFRKLGGLLLSLGMCFMFVLPLLYVLGWYTLSIPNISVVIDEDRFDSNISALSEDWITAAVFSTWYGFWINRIFEHVNLGKIPIVIIKSIIDGFVMAGQIVMYAQYVENVHANNPDFYFTEYTKLNKMYKTTFSDMGVFDYISRFLIIALALPILNIYIFFSFVRGLSPLLGGDAEIPALGRFL